MDVMPIITGIWFGNCSFRPFPLWFHTITQQFKPKYENLIIQTYHPAQIQCPFLLLFLIPLPRHFPLCSHHRWWVFSFFVGVLAARLWFLTVPHRGGRSGGRGYAGQFLCISPNCVACRLYIWPDYVCIQMLSGIELKIKAFNVSQSSFVLILTNRIFHVSVTSWPVLFLVVVGKSQQGPNTYM